MGNNSKGWVVIGDDYNASAYPRQEYNNRNGAYDDDYLRFKQERIRNHRGLLESYNNINSMAESHPGIFGPFDNSAFVVGVNKLLDTDGYMDRFNAQGDMDNIRFSAAEDHAGKANDKKAFDRYLNKYADTINGSLSNHPQSITSLNKRGAAKAKDEYLRNIQSIKAHGGQRNLDDVINRIQRGDLDKPEGYDLYRNTDTGYFDIRPAVVEQPTQKTQPKKQRLQHKQTEPTPQQESNPLNMRDEDFEKQYENIG